MSVENEDTAPNEKQMLMARAKLLGITYSNNITVEKLREKINEKMGIPNEESEEQESETENQSENQEGTEIEETIEEAPEVVEPVKQEEIAPLVLTPTGDIDALLAQIAELKNENAKLTGIKVQPEVNAFEEAQKIADNKTYIEAPVSQTKARKKSLREYLVDENMKLVRVRITCMDPKKASLKGEFITVANSYIGTVTKFVPFGEATEDGYHIPYCIYNILKDRKFLHVRTIKDKRTGAEYPDPVYLKEFAIDVLDPLTPEELENLKVAQQAAGSID